MRHAITGLAITLIASLALPGFCQPDPGNAKRPATPAADPNKEKEVLSQKVDLPDMPEYSGKHEFVFGRVVHQKIGDAYMMTYSTPEPMDSTIDWYASALPSYKWTIQVRNRHYLSAIKGDKYASIRVNTSAKKGMRCDFTVSYFEPRK